MLSSFLGSPYSRPPNPASVRLFPDPPIHSITPPHPEIPLHWSIETSEGQGSLLSLMPDTAILCYIWGWSHGPLPLWLVVRLCEL